MQTLVFWKQCCAIVSSEIARLDSFFCRVNSRLSGGGNMTSTAPRTKRSMFGSYSELSKSLSEAKACVQRGFEQLKTLKNVKTFEYRMPSFRKKSKKSKKSSSTRKTEKINSPPYTPVKLKPSELSRVSTINSRDINLTYPIKRKQYPSNHEVTAATAPFSIIISLDSSDSETDSDSVSESIDDDDEPNLLSIKKNPYNNNNNNYLNNNNKKNYSPLNSSHSYPRISRSRKIENINIVFPKPFPDHKIVTKASARNLPTTNKTTEPTSTSTPKAYAIHGHIGAYHQDTISTINADESTLCESQDNASYYMTKVDAKDATICKPVRKANYKSPEAVAEVHGYNRRRAPISSATFVKSTRSAPKHNRATSYSTDSRSTSEEETNSSSDSNLTRSTSISLKSYYDDSEDDQPAAATTIHRAVPVQTILESDQEEDQEVYWIPRKMHLLPRTSSHLSMMSKATSWSCGSSAGVSPGLSPIKSQEKRESNKNAQRKAWGLTYKLEQREKTAKQLFRIDETVVLDSGYSDRSGAISSRATTHEGYNHRWMTTPSPSSSLSSSPILVDCENVGCVGQGAKGVLDGSGPYVLNSFYV